MTDLRKAAREALDHLERDINIREPSAWRELTKIRAANLRAALAATQAEAMVRYMLGGASALGEKPEPNPEWEAKADAYHAESIAKNGIQPRETLEMLKRWKADAEPANERGQVTFSRAMLDSAADALDMVLNNASTTGGAIEPSEEAWEAFKKEMCIRAPNSWITALRAAYVHDLPRLLSDAEREGMERAAAIAETACKDFEDIRVKTKARVIAAAIRQAKESVGKI